MKTQTIVSDIKAALECKNWTENASGECMEIQIDGWRIEARRDGEEFWVIGEDGDIDAFVWCGYMEEYQLELSNGVTDSIPAETGLKIEEAIAKLREEWRRNWFPCDS